MHPHSRGHHMLCHGHSTVSSTSQFSVNMKSTKNSGVPVSWTHKHNHSSRIEYSFPWQITYCDKTPFQSPGKLIRRSYRSERKVPDTHLGFIIFMFSGVHLPKSLSGEEEIFAMMDKYSFSIEVEIRVTTCLGSQTRITIILRRAHITCRL